MKIARLDFLFEIPIRGGDDSGVDADIGEAADPLECLLLEEAQQLGLTRRCRASVNAPRSCPNSSLSSNCSGSADAVMLTNGFAARSLL